MPVALVVSHPANMPGYNSTIDLEEAQSLSRYCFLHFSFQDIASFLFCSLFSSQPFLLCETSCIEFSYCLVTLWILPAFEDPCLSGYFNGHILGLQATRMPRDLVTENSTYPSRVRNKNNLKKKKRKKHGHADGEYGPHMLIKKSESQDLSNLLELQEWQWLLDLFPGLFKQDHIVHGPRV